MSLALVLRFVFCKTGKHKKIPSVFLSALVEEHAEVLRWSLGSVELLIMYTFV